MNHGKSYPRSLSDVLFRSYDFKPQLKSSIQSKVKSGSAREQRSTKLTVQLKKFVSKFDTFNGNRKNTSKQSESALNLTLNFSTRNTSAVLTSNSEEHNNSHAGNLSLVSRCENSDSYLTVVKQHSEGGDDIYVGIASIQNIGYNVNATETTEIDEEHCSTCSKVDSTKHIGPDGDAIEPDENDDETFSTCNKEDSNIYESDIESTLSIHKNNSLTSIGSRSCHLIPTLRCSHEKVSYTGRQNHSKITNREVLQEFVQESLVNFEEKGCFKRPLESIRQHVLYPQKQEFRMPPLTPVPIYPNDKNEQININPFFPLLNTYRQWPNDLQISASALARAGFHCVTADGQRVGCRSCGIELHIDDFNGNDPFTVHRQMSSLCPAVYRDGLNGQATTSSLDVNDTEIDHAALQGLQLDTPTENLSNANGTHQVETIDERRSHHDGRNNVHTDSTPTASASEQASASPLSGASAPPHPIITYPPRNPGQVTSETRRQSFRNWPGSLQDIDTLVQAGLFFTGEEDIVRCFHCDIGLAEWDHSDDPWVEHARHSPDCPFLRSQRDDQFISNIQRRWAQIYTPKTPHMSQASTRLESYDPSWPRDYVIQTPQQLSEAGFFYTGVTDTVRCHYCDGGLREWEPEDDPWTEHARWFPFCKFVIKVKGLSFIQAAARNEDNDTDLDNPTAVTSPLTRAEPSFEEKCRRKEQENPMLSAAVESVKAFGYKKKMIKKAVVVHIEATGKREFSASDLMEILFQMEDKESSLEVDGSDSSSDEISLTPKAMAMENEYLKTQQQCELCRIRDKCMVFIPCGHRIACEPCGKSQTSCSVCFKEVTSCVKTFLG